MPWLLGFFIVEVLVCAGLVLLYPDWRWVVFAILGIDLAALVGFWWLSTRPPVLD